jgi:hypothetical protein
MERKKIRRNGVWSTTLIASVAGALSFVIGAFVTDYLDLRFHQAGGA